ncbi:hypothetical protein [Secundilactobacillus collinoides]|uniref:hypothetical protein n=1 Tax=Secundilactobacillus collinoides TaxID=33960 RepID=UPI000AF751EB
MDKRILTHITVFIEGSTKFHTLDFVQIGRALDAERLRVLHTIEDHKSRLYKILKSQWKLLHKDQNELNASKPVFLRGINEYMT